MTKYFQVDKGYYKLKINPEKKALELPVLLDISANSQVEAELKVNELEEFLKNIFYERITTEDISISEDEIQNQINGLFFKVMNFMNVDEEIVVSERLIISNIKFYLDSIIKLNELKLRANEIRFSRVVNKSNKNNYHISGDASLNKVLFDTAIKYNYSELTEFTENHTSYYYQDLNQLDPFNLGQMNDYLKEILVLHRRVMRQTNLNAIF